MPGAEIYIPDYKDEEDPNEYEKQKEQARPDFLTQEEVMKMFKDIPF
jgi:hypothetical protein